MISEKTPVTISLIISLIAGLSWLFALSAKTEAMAVRVQVVEAASMDKVKEDAKFQREVIERLARIEVALKYKQ